MGVFSGKMLILLWCFSNVVWQEKKSNFCKVLECAIFTAYDNMSSLVVVGPITA